MGSLLGDKDLGLFDRVAREVNHLAGTTAITYFALILKKVPRDPVYNEPAQEYHEKNPIDGQLGIPFEGLIEYPERSYRTGEEGRTTTFDAKVHLARKDFELKFPITPPPLVGVAWREPKIGDILLVQGRHYDVTNIEWDGQVNDTEKRHTIYILTLKNRTEFDARRRLEGQV